MKSLGIPTVQLAPPQMISWIKTWDNFWRPKMKKKMGAGRWYICRRRECVSELSANRCRLQPRPV